MKPKIAERIPARAWELLGKTRQIIHALPATIERPAFILGIKVDIDVAISRAIPNCHEVARALAVFLPVEVHDGFVSTFDTNDIVRHHEHSWLTIMDEDPRIILDPWPLGVVSGPALFIQDYGQHFGPEYCFLNHRTEKFNSGVEALTDAIRVVTQRLWGTI